MWGLRVPGGIGDRLTLRALRESGGHAIAVSDESAAKAMRDVHLLGGHRRDRRGRRDARSPARTAFARRRSSISHRALQHGLVAQILAAGALVNVAAVVLAAVAALSVPQTVIAALSRLEPVDRFASLPAAIRAGDFAVDGVSAAGWRMAEPGGAFSATDVPVPQRARATADLRRRAIRDAVPDPLRARRHRALLRDPRAFAAARPLASDLERRRSQAGREPRRPARVARAPSSGTPLAAAVGQGRLLTPVCG